MNGVMGMPLGEWLLSYIWNNDNDGRRYFNIIQMGNPDLLLFKINNLNIDNIIELIPFCDFINNEETYVLSELRSSFKFWANAAATYNIDAYDVTNSATTNVVDASTVINVSYYNIPIYNLCNLSNFLNCSNLLAICIAFLRSI